jgi:hypothetical protein
VYTLDMDLNDRSGEKEKKEREKKKEKKALSCCGRQKGVKDKGEGGKKPFMVSNLNVKYLSISCGCEKLP